MPESGQGKPSFALSGAYDGDVAPSPDWSREIDCAEAANEVCAFVLLLMEFDAIEISGHLREPFAEAVQEWLILAERSGALMPCDDLDLAATEECEK